MDFVLRCAEYDVLQQYPNTGLEYSYRIPGHCSTREQRSVHGLSGTERLRMILYADDIAILCKDIDELAVISNIYDKIFTRFGLQISYGKRRNCQKKLNQNLPFFPSGTSQLIMFVLLNI